MHSQTFVAAWRPAHLDGWRRDLLGALCAALLLVVFQAARGFPTLFDSGGDNDAMMRLTQIRDFIAGQGWFDLHQYRMGVEGGFLIHWSRIVDLPVAAIILVGSALTGSMAMGEMIASVVWPTALLVFVLFFLLRIARQYAGPATFLPTLVIGAITLNLIGMFTPRSLDHHNLQLLLALATISLLLSPGWRAAAGAGLCCALMLAVGMETLPYVAIAGACFAVGFLLNDRKAAESAIGFGLGFAISASVALLTTVPYQSWWTPQCDAFSAGLCLVAIGAGLGLSLVAVVSANGGTRARAIALGILGAAVAVAAIILVPQCFRAPYSSLDPKLQKYWIDAIMEAQPLWRMITLRTDATPQNYATPLIGVGLLIAGMIRGGVRRENAIPAAFLIGAFAVSVWQVRGANFSVPFAIIPLSGWVANARRNVEKQIPGAAIRVILAWLLSLNLIWAVAAHSIADVVAPDRAGKAPEAEGDANVDTECYADATYKDLARLPATTVLTISNLGAPLIANTPHRTLAGPSHRNIEGNMLTLDAFMGSADEALTIIRRNHVGLIAFCPGNGESGSTAGWAPDGLMADIIAGKLPAWLEPIPETMAAPLKLYRIR